MWKSIKNLLNFGAGSDTRPQNSQPDKPEIPDVARLDASSNPWGVPLIAVHTVTQTMQSVTANLWCAQNAVSYGNEDGLGFVGTLPSSARSIAASFTYPTDGELVDGALFIPREMEHKWALYFHRNQILCVRSWLRSVMVVAYVKQTPNAIEVIELRGTFGVDEEPPELTLRIFDFLVRSHALDTDDAIPFPAPVPESVADDAQKAAMWCYSLYGKMAHFATVLEVPNPPPPNRPMRSYSLLHIAAARADIQTMANMVTRGVSVDQPDRDGQPPLHWALSSDKPEPVIYLLDHGAQIDYKDPEGATMLMQVVQQMKPLHALMLLDRGANPNLTDNRGFTALHRAAYLGHEGMVKALLRFGADKTIVAQGLLARDHARSQGYGGVVNLLDQHNGN